MDRRDGFKIFFNASFVLRLTAIFSMSFLLFFLFLSDHITHAIMRYSSTSRDDSLIKSRALIIPWDEERIHIRKER